MFIKRKCANFTHKSAKLELKKIGGKVIVDKMGDDNTVKTVTTSSVKKTNKKKQTEVVE